MSSSLQCSAKDTIPPNVMCRIPIYPKLTIGADFRGHQIIYPSPVALRRRSPFTGAEKGKKKEIKKKDILIRKYRSRILCNLIIIIIKRPP